MVGAALGGLGVCFLPSLGGSRPVGRRESEREKRQPQGGGGPPPKGWKEVARRLPFPALIQPQSWQEGEAEGSAHRSPGKQRQVTQGPFAAPEVGLGIEFRDW